MLLPRLLPQPLAVYYPLSRLEAGAGFVATAGERVRPEPLRMTIREPVVRAAAVAESTRLLRGDFLLRLQQVSGLASTTKTGKLTGLFS